DDRCLSGANDGASTCTVSAGAGCECPWPACCAAAASSEGEGKEKDVCRPAHSHRATAHVAACVGRTPSRACVRRQS
ncbi:unnamed protein product, partial [Mycena citricolor]